MLLNKGIVNKGFGESFKIIIIIFDIVNVIEVIMM